MLDSKSQVGSQAQSDRSWGQLSRRGCALLAQRPGSVAPTHKQKQPNKRAKGEHVATAGGNTKWPQTVEVPLMTKRGVSRHMTKQHLQVFA